MDTQTATQILLPLSRMTPTAGMALSPTLPLPLLMNYLRADNPRDLQLLQAENPILSQTQTSAVARSSDAGARTHEQHWNAHCRGSLCLCRACRH